MSQYRVWWIPQIPGKAFKVPVESPQQGKWLCDVLADYDLFQYHNHIKPDYSNAGGVQGLDEDGWYDLNDNELEESAP